MDFEEFFGLNDNPFRLTPDPDYFFSSNIHSLAIQTLSVAVDAGESVMLLTGDPGTGKTLTGKKLAATLGDEVDSAFVFNPRLSSTELLTEAHRQFVGSADGLPDKKPESYLESIKDKLAQTRKSGRWAVLFLDEAQELDDDALGMLIRLSELEKKGEHLLQLILIGGIDLEDRLKSSKGKPLDRRVNIRFRMVRLSRAETLAYVQHRIKVSGGAEPFPFATSVLAQIHKITGGLPRLINIVCERAMMAAFVEDKKVVEKPHFQRALKSLAGEETQTAQPSTDFLFKYKYPLVGLAVVILIVIGIMAIRGGDEDAPGNTSTSTSLETPVAEAPAPETQPDAVAVTRENTTAGSTDDSLEESTGDEETLETEIIPEEPEITTPALPTPPPEAAYIPSGVRFLTLDRSDETAYLWEGGENTPSLKAEFHWDTPPPEGMFMVGQTLKNQKVLFGYSRQGHQPPPPSKQLWNDLKEMLPGVVPMLAYSPEKKTETERLEKAEEVHGLVLEWAEAWRSKDIDRFIQFYGDTFASYTETGARQSVYPKAEYKRIKNDIFRKSGDFFLTLSDPLCLLDPADPKLAVAVFYQRYESTIYKDEGTKVLYFKLVEENGQTGWKIAAKMWIPGPDS